MQPLQPLRADELAAWLRLALTPGVGNATMRRLLTRFGTPQSIFRQAATALEQCVHPNQASALRAFPPDWPAALQRTEKWLQDSTPQRAHALLTLGDPRYPPALLEIEDPPVMLYVAGSERWLARAAPLIDHRRALAIVGSRNPTAQGTENARSFGQTLAQQGWCVVSGLALGVDAAAHTGALQAIPTSTPLAHPQTVAVVGTGVDRIYPRSHQALAHSILEHGLILSEYPLGTPPVATNFPKRNRIISGLSCGTLVVEAALASGSLITARLASEQGREVFAIPGSIHAPQSKGCHALLRQGAKLVESAPDILEEFPAISAAPLHTNAVPPERPPASVIEHPVLSALGFDPIGFDELQARTGWDTPSLQGWLLEQELEGSVARQPGGRFQRLIRG